MRARYFAIVVSRCTASRRIGRFAHRQRPRCQRRTNMVHERQRDDNSHSWYQHRAHVVYRSPFEGPGHVACSFVLSCCYLSCAFSSVYLFVCVRCLGDFSCCVCVLSCDCCAVGNLIVEEGATLSYISTTFQLWGRSFHAHHSNTTYRRLITHRK